MDRPSPSPGTVTLMGSGELTESMSRVHHWIVSQIDGPAKAVFLDTPAGFELNSDNISEKARTYVRRYVGVPCALASFKSAERATTAETRNALRKIEASNYIFAGPGSPTYVIRNWRGTPIFEAVTGRVNAGAHLVLASAAAIAIGHYSLPVYEIFKVGDEPHWVEGLNLLAPYGLDLTIVPHWNNAEGGTYDTRFCFMGQPRFAALEALLPESTVLLGIDEYTACILAPSRNECRVMGAGQVTIRCRGRETAFQADSTFSLDELRSGTTAVARPVIGARVPETAIQVGDTLARQVAETERALTPDDGGHPALGELAGQAFELAQAIERAQESGVPQEQLSPAQARLRQLVEVWQTRLDASGGDLVANLAPFVDLLLDLRSQLRAAKQWALADEVRERLSALGIVIEDTPAGTTWRQS